MCVCVFLLASSKINDHMKVFFCVSTVSGLEKHLRQVNEILQKSKKCKSLPGWSGGR